MTKIATLLLLMATYSASTQPLTKPETGVLETVRKSMPLSKEAIGMVLTMPFFNILVAKLILHKF